LARFWLQVVVLTDPGHAVASADGSQNVNYLHSGRAKEKRCGTLAQAVAEIASFYLE
jgi:hypothetical protein